MATKHYYKPPSKPNSVKLYRPDLFSNAIQLAGPAPFAEHLRYRIRQQYGHGNAPILAERIESFYDTLFSGLDDVEQSIPGLNAEWPYSFTPLVYGDFKHDNYVMNFRFAIGQSDTNPYNCARQHGLSRGEAALIWPSMANVHYDEKLTGPMWEWTTTLLRYMLWAMELEHYVEQTLIKLKLVVPSAFRSEDTNTQSAVKYYKKKFLAKVNPVYGPTNNVEPLEVPLDLWQRKVSHQNNLQICQLMDMIAVVTAGRADAKVEVFHCDATKVIEHVDADY